MIFLKKAIITIFLIITLVFILLSYKAVSATSAFFNIGEEFTTPSFSTSSGLVAYYPFDNDYQDYSGNGNQGTVKGVIPLVPAVVNNGAKFDGTSWIEVNDSNSLDLYNAYTFSVWIYKENAGAGGWSVILEKADSSAMDNHSPYGFAHTQDGYYPYVHFVYDNKFNMITSNTGTSFKEWNFVTVSWDGSDVKFFINGVLKDNKAWSNPLPNSDSKLLIGCGPVGATEYFVGIMDELRIYNRAISQEEVTSLYEADSPIPTATTSSPLSTPVPSVTTVEPPITSALPETSTPTQQAVISPVLTTSTTPPIIQTPAAEPPASVEEEVEPSLLDILLKIIGYISIVMLVVSFIFIIKNLRKRKRLTILNLIIPVLVSIVFLILYSMILNIHSPTAISASLAIIGLGLGILWSRTSQLTVNKNVINVRRSIWYVVILAMTVVFTQVMAVTSTPELAAYGLSTIYFSTGLAVSTNISLMFKYLQISSRIKKTNYRVCSRCQFKNEADAKVCSKCGYAIVPNKPKTVPIRVSNAIIKACPKCKVENLPDSLYCENCGFNLKSSFDSDM